MKQHNIYALMGALTLSGTQLALAEGSAVDFSGNVTLTSDYVYRGISQSDGGPAVQGGFDVTYDIFYAGTWASSVDFGDDTTMEIDFYGGLSPSVGDTQFDVGAIYYAYPDSPELPTGKQDFVEVYAGISHELGPVSPSVKLSYSPDFYGETGEAFYLEGALAVELHDVLSLSAGVGASMFDNDLLNDDYVAYNIGATASQWGFEFDLRFHNTSNRVGANDDVVVFSLSRSIN